MLARRRRFPKPDLSQLKVLRSLEVGDLGQKSWEFGLTGLNTAHTSILEVFSTITSPVFSGLVVVIARNRFARLLSDDTVFVALPAMNEVRPFELVFLVLHSSAFSLSQEARQVFKRNVQLATAKGLFDFLSSPPTLRIASPYPFPSGLRLSYSSFESV